MSEPTHPQPFDERAALEELEQLAEKIQVSRRQRAQAVDEFDAFVRGFKKDRWEGPERRLPEAPLRAQPIADRQAVMPAPVVTSRETLETPVDALEPNAPAPIAIAPTWKDMIRQPIARWTLAAVGVLALLVLIWRPWSSVPERGASAAVGAPSNTAAPAPTPAPVATPPIAKAPARAVNVEIVTLRPVWTRVTIDDRKELEREVPGGQRLTFGADRAITIRAGDAGGLRVILDGKDLGVMGRDGQIASKTFGKP